MLSKFCVLTGFMKFDQEFSVDIYFATSQPEFLPTQVGKLWKAINSNQKQTNTVCNNLHKYSKIVLILFKTKQLIMSGILFD